MIGFEGNILLQMFLFPVIVLGLWHLIFNSSNSVMTKIFVEGGYMLLGIPLIIVTFLSIPMLALMFWAPSAGKDTEVTQALLIVLGALTILAEYFWIKRQVNAIEEREQMSIWQFIRRELSKETRDQRRKDREESTEQSASYFDEISEMNRKRRELDREEKEKLRRALLGELDSEE